MQGWTPSANELPAYRRWYGLIQKDSQGNVEGRHVANFMRGSGLGPQWLKQIWIVSTNRSGAKALNMHGFFVACRLCALAQHQINPIAANLGHPNVGLPNFDVGAHAGPGKAFIGVMRFHRSDTDSLLVNTCSSTFY